ncbi:unnamed protein product, partial [Prorocentrum cordatum]
VKRCAENESKALPKEKSALTSMNQAGNWLAGQTRTARSLLQSLTDAETSYPRMISCVAAGRKMTVKVPAGVLDTGLKSSRNMRVTLIYHNNTNYVQVLTGAAIEDSMIRQMSEPERNYFETTVHNPSCNMEMPTGSEHLTKILRFPPYEDKGKGTEAGSSTKQEESREDAEFIKIELPDFPKEDLAYQEALSTTALSVIEQMSNYPDQRDALLRVMKNNFGLEMTALEAERQDSYDREQKVPA